MSPDAERTFQHHGDDLYQLALLLTLHPEQAAQALVRAARSLAISVQADELTTIRTLLTVLPEERPGRTPKKLPWPATENDENTLVLAEIARLPRLQRLALDLVLRRDYTFAQIASLFENSPDRAADAFQAALLALAPIVVPNVPLGELTGISAPDACKPTREALARGETGLHPNPEIRGHLALCSACRAIEQQWAQLTTSAERALRSALRDVSLPDHVSSRIQEALAPSARQNSQFRIPTRVLQIATPLVVLLIVALLVLPRPSLPTLTGAGPTSDAPPRELIQQALNGLYAPTSGEGAWHGTWEMRWDFSDNLYAYIRGDVWVDQQSGRHRTQLVHRDGGGPYEFQLGNSRTLWYAANELYGRSILAGLYDQYPNRVSSQMSVEQQQEFLQARLRAGAWGIARTYLEQGVRAESIQSWGKQRAPDGSELVVVGFQGYSPLMNAPSAGQEHTPVFVLLTLDSNQGRLREVRELSGPAGAEQTGRTTWRFLGEEWITDAQSQASAFDLQRAYNGTGIFQEVSGIADPDLPIVPSSAVRSPSNYMSSWVGGIRLPQQAPQGTTRALFIDQSFTSSLDASVAVYLGEGRSLYVVHQFGRLPVDPSTLNGEMFQIKGQTALLIPAATQRYELYIEWQIGQAQSERVSTSMYAAGFTRAEMLDLANSLQVFDYPQFRGQAHIFVASQPHDPMARSALLSALEADTPLPNGQARHLVVRHFQRRGDLEDTLRDPFHLPLYSRGDTTLIETWSRTQNNQPEQVNIHRNESEVRYQEYSSPNHYWIYDADEGYVRAYRQQISEQMTITEMTQGVIEMLGCGGTHMHTDNGQRIITSVETAWTTQSCRYTAYGYLADLQRKYLSGGWEDFHQRYENMQIDQGPFVVDVTDGPLTSTIVLDEQNRVVRLEFSGENESGRVLLESFEVVQNNTAPADQLASEVFQPEPPEELGPIVTITGENAPTLINDSKRLTVTEAIEWLGTPLWYFPPSETVTLTDIVVVEPSTEASAFTYLASDVFQDAYNRGLAMRIGYLPLPGDTSQTAFPIYVGTSKDLGSFLRKQRGWTRSEPVSLALGDRSVVGWEVDRSNGSSWTIIELDGTIVMVHASTEARREAVQLLRRYE